MQSDSIAVNHTHRREGGWGFAIIASGFVVHFLLIGLFQVQSLFFVEWQREFHATSLEASLMTAMLTVPLGVVSKYFV